MSYYDTDYFTPVETASSINGALIWTITSVVLAIIGGIALYFTIFSEKNSGKYNGVLAKAYDLVRFKYFVIDDLFKILYLICALLVTLISFTYIGKWKFLVILLGGNVSLRITYELVILFIELCQNVRELNNKRKK